MSMITGCPACGTLFRVVPDQLKISDGWVRCGHCSEVFDATAHMQSVAPDEAPDAAGMGPGAMPQPGDMGLGSPAPAPATPAAIDGQWASPPEPTIQRPGGSPPASATREADHASGFHASIPAGTAMLTRPAGLEDEPAYAEQVDSVLSEARASRSHVEDDDDEQVRLDDPALDDVSFVQRARRQAFWRRPLVRVALLLVVLLLGVLLAAQLAVHDRDRLAALHPEWKPWLQRLCAPAGCTVGPLRRIDAVVIDSSGFSRLRQDTYKLALTLKNQAALPVAVPAVELTLTDGQDQPVLRRVLGARELGAPSDTLAPASDWSASVVLAIAPPAGARVAGYRLVAFYP